MQHSLVRRKDKFLCHVSCAMCLQLNQFSFLFHPQRFVFSFVSTSFSFKIVVVFVLLCHLYTFQFHFFSSKKKKQYFVLQFPSNEWIEWIEWNNIRQWRPIKKRKAIGLRIRCKLPFLKRVIMQM